MCGSQGPEKPWQAEKKKTLNEVKIDPNEESELYIDALKTLNVGHVKQNNQSCEEVAWYESIRVNNKVVNFKLDTGAEVSVLPLNIYNKIDLKCTEMKKTNLTLMSYGCPDFKLKPEGTTSLKCVSKKGKIARIEFSIVKTEGPPLLGLNGCLKLGLVKKIGNVSANNWPKTKTELIDKYSINFKGLGKFPGKQHIEIKEGAIPKVQKNRRIPVSLHSKLKSSLNELESKGIISRVEGPSDWVNSLVVVEKTNGSLRLCLDPKPLNDVIKREHFMIPTAEDITSRLSGKCVFSVIDMKDGFWQVEIDENSAKLCTFATPFGRYQFHHLPFGICSSPEIFQKKNMELFGDIPGVEIYFDDIICAGSSVEEHDLALKGVMERAMKHNVKFNPDKFQYRLQEVKFMGQIISKEGLKADEGHVRAIVEMETPRSKSELMRILGMAKFLAKFVPKMSEVTAPLRDLTRNEVDWCWGKEQEDSLSKLKWYISNSPVLKFFDSSKPVEIQTDASKDGLGCCLMQEGHPVAYASRSLTKCEQRYAQIEKELLSIVFSTEKFHQFIYGYKVTVMTDHKPLEAIIEKNLDSVSARLQRMLLKLLKYKLDIKYLPGKLMFVADTLSRAYLKDEVKDDLEMEFIIHNLVKKLPISEKKKLEFQEATKQDEWLSQVIKYVESSWPEKRVLPPELKQYWKLKQGINVVEGLLIFNEKIVVPDKLRREMLSLIHGSHCGVVKCKLRARQILYWPNMAADIEKFVYQCRICEKFRKQNQKQPLISYPTPERPWERIAADLLEFGGKNYMVVVDSYSNWIELCKLRGKMAEHVIKYLKLIFSRHGIPDVFMSDNMPFASCEFKKFADDWSFNTITSSPGYPQSNGLAEKAVSIVKNMLRKAHEEGREEDISLYLLEYRSTPLPHMGLSPSQLLMSRMLKTKIPVSGPILRPQINQPGMIRKKVKIHRKYQKLCYDRSAKTLPPLKDNDPVVIRKEKCWIPGRVIKAYQDSPRSYMIQDGEGNILRRNRKFLRKSAHEPIMIDSGSDELELRDERNIEHRQGNDPNTPDVRKTRSGRVIRKPAYLNDYVN